MVPKYLGRDVELSTTGLCERGDGIAPFDVARAVVRHAEAAFEGEGTPCFLPHDATSSALSQDSHRVWTANGGCVYIDLAHVEVCNPETRFARRFAAQSIAMLRAADAARARAELETPAGTRYRLAATNVDTTDPGVSWGSHVSVSIERELFELLFRDPREPGVLGFVTSAIAAAIPFFGAGTVLPLRRGGSLYSLSARAPHLTRAVSHTTTEPFQRGILNSRDEALADDQARLHLIGFDQAVVSEALLAGYLQAVLAAAEAHWCGPTLRDPVRALRSWSFGLDPGSGEATGVAERLDGRAVTLAEFVGEVASSLRDGLDALGVAWSVAPDVGELLDRIVVLATELGRGSLELPSRHLGWAAKLLWLRAVRDRFGGGLESPRVRLADHDFLDTDPSLGTIWKLWRRGVVDPLVGESDVERAIAVGPRDSRAFLRGRLIRRFGDALTDVDWDRVEVRQGAGVFAPRWRLDLPSLEGPAPDAVASAIGSARDVQELEERLSFPDARPRPVDPIESFDRELDTRISRPEDSTKGRRARR